MLLHSQLGAYSKFRSCQLQLHSNNDNFCVGAANEAKGHKQTSHDSVRTSVTDRHSWRASTKGVMCRIGSSRCIRPQTPSYVTTHVAAAHFAAFRQNSGLKLGRKGRSFISCNVAARATQKSKPAHTGQERNDFLRSGLFTTDLAGILGWVDVRFARTDNTPKLSPVPRMRRNALAVSC
jgi:hypothetical protein